MGTERQRSLAAGLRPKMSPEVAAVQGSHACSSVSHPSEGCWPHSASKNPSQRTSTPKESLGGLWVDLYFNCTSHLKFLGDFAHARP